MSEYTDQDPYLRVLGAVHSFRAGQIDEGVAELRRVIDAPEMPDAVRAVFLAKGVALSDAVAAADRKATATARFDDAAAPVRVEYSGPYTTGGVNLSAEWNRAVEEAEYAMLLKERLTER